MLDKSNQIGMDDAVGKTIRQCEIINYSQFVISFTDDSHLTITSRISSGKPWVGTAVITGAIEKEWRIPEEVPA